MPKTRVPLSDPDPRPTRVGGLATPFGVYLTTGSYRGGASDWALIATGALLGACNLLLIILTDHLSSISGIGLSLRAYGPLLLIGFLAMVRLSPVAGYHAAEHQTVHALEQGLPLSPDCVRHQPRAHPRCGSNLVAFALLCQILIAAAGPLSDLDLPLVLLASLGVAALIYRPFGFALQQLGTTKPPTPKQTLSGIRAARELVAAWQKATPVNRWLRVWRLGALQIMLGAMGISWVFMLLGF